MLEMATDPFHLPGHRIPLWPDVPAVNREARLVVSAKPSEEKARCAQIGKNATTHIQCAEAHPGERAADGGDEPIRERLPP